MDIEVKLRRTLLYVPGNSPSMLQNLPVFHSDGVLIDLEDAVPLSEKDAARILVRKFLTLHKDRDKEIFVRINPLTTRHAQDDLREVLPALPTGIRLPKADTPEIVERCDTLLTEYEEQLGIDIGRFKLILSIESALGLINVVEIAQASKRIVALAFGAEDFTATMEIDRTKTGEELFHARTKIAWAAKAAGVQAIDTIFPDVNDMEAFRRETELIKKLGFAGKSLINPRQIDIVHDVFRPKQDEIDHAMEVMAAIQKAREMGTGVIALKGKMVDAPVVKRAARVLKTAASLGIIDYHVTDKSIYGEE